LIFVVESVELNKVMQIVRKSSFQNIAPLLGMIYCYCTLLCCCWWKQPHCLCT